MDLLSFPSFQCLDGAGDQGVPLGLVLDACAILAHNRPGQLRLLDSPDTTPIHKGYYLYIVHDENGARDDDYPVCASFRDWALPHALPPRWRGPESNTTYYPVMTPSEASFAVKMDDSFHCIVTGSFGCLDSSHLVPSAEADWRQFNTSTRDLDSVYNEVSLRADLSKPGLDSGLFVFAPYAGEMLIFTDATAAPTLAYEHHLRPINVPTRIRWVYWMDSPFWVGRWRKPRSVIMGNTSMPTIRAHSSIQGLRALKGAGILTMAAGVAQDETTVGVIAVGLSREKQQAASAPAARANPNPHPTHLNIVSGYSPWPRPQTQSSQTSSLSTMCNAGATPGYSAMKQLAFDWFVKNPQISAVRGADERSEGDGDAGEDFTDDASPLLRTATHADSDPAFPTVNYQDPHIPDDGESGTPFLRAIRLSCPIGYRHSASAASP
ncbi:hypothetical protein C8J57DRAFT_1250090 [Mycena rebaudengoi]|nr:hypothetical protein C8J57DRAFT_1250090 [Mycena rebaudengoi]